MRMGFDEPEWFKRSWSSFNIGARYVAQHISVVGIDIAKQVFHLVGMDERGKVVMRKRFGMVVLVASWNGFRIPIQIATIDPERKGHQNL